MQLALNAPWTPAFFGDPPSFRRFSTAAALLLLPYLGWVLFATALNLEILRRN